MTETGTFSLNKGDTQSFERQIASVTCSTGSLIVNDGKETKEITDGETFDTNGSPTVSIFAVDHANYAVAFADFALVAPGPVVEEAVRGDGPGNVDTGSYESRTLKELRKLARDRRISGYSDLDKDALIEKLRD